MVRIWLIHQMCTYALESIFDKISTNVTSSKISVGNKYTNIRVQTIPGCVISYCDCKVLYVNDVVKRNGRTASSDDKSVTITCSKKNIEWSNGTVQEELVLRAQFYTWDLISMS